MIILNYRFVQVKLSERDIFVSNFYVDKLKIHLYHVYLPLVQFEIKNTTHTYDIIISSNTLPNVYTNFNISDFEYLNHQMFEIRSCGMIAKDTFNHTPKDEIELNN